MTNEINTIITYEILKAEEMLLRNVLTQLLKREIFPDDFKKLQKFKQENEFDKYYLAYDNLKLGTVFYKNINMKFIVEFVPFDFNELFKPMTNYDKTKVIL